MNLVVQAPAAAALDSLAYRSLRHRQEMAAAGIIPYLTSYLQQRLQDPALPTTPTDDDLTPNSPPTSNTFGPDQPIRPTLNLLHSLALDTPAHRRELASCGAIPILVGVIGAKAQLFPVQLAQAAGILGRMAADGQDFRDVIASAGAVPGLVGMLQGPGASAAGQEQGLGALELLAANSPACRALVASADGGPMMVQLLDAPLAHVRKRAAAAIAALALDGPALLGIATSTAVQQLANLVLSPPDPETQVQLHSFNIGHEASSRWAPEICHLNVIA